MLVVRLWQKKVVDNGSGKPLGSVTDFNVEYFSQNLPEAALNF
jgi:hypothetical protein